MAFSLDPTGILGGGVMYRSSFASGGNSNVRMPRSVFVNHGSTTTTYTFHVGNDFGMGTSGGYLMFTGHGWQTDRIHGMIEWHNAGGSGGITNVGWREILRHNISISLSIPSGETHKIKITLTECHNNSHGWNFHIYGGH